MLAVLSFQNSPLFQYLHDLGHTDFEACPTSSQEEGDGEEAPPLGDAQKRSVSAPLPADPQTQAQTTPYPPLCFQLPYPGGLLVQTDS